MKIQRLPFKSILWDGMEREEHKGITGTSFWQTCQFGDIRIRIVEYSANYLADHWCKKGHIIFCLEGEFDSELSDGRRAHFTSGMSYLVADDSEAHRFSTSKAGAKVFIVD